MKTEILIDNHIIILNRSISSFIKFVPGVVLARITQHIINTLFNRHLDEQKINFLKGRKVRVNITDLRMAFDITLPERRLSVSRPSGIVDLEITTNHMDILSLSTGDVDSDTLFFKRRIKISGDTELSLEIKNFLDTIEIANEYPEILNRATKRYLDVCKKSGTSMCPRDGK